jgi:hypothetical protein
VVYQLSQGRERTGKKIKNIPFLIAVHDAREERVHICRGADEQEDHQEERLEVEDCCLDASISIILGAVNPQGL